MNYKTIIRNPINNYLYGSEYLYKNGLEGFKGPNRDDFNMLSQGEIDHLRKRYKGLIPIHPGEYCELKGD